MLRQHDPSDLEVLDLVVGSWCLPSKQDKIDEWLLLLPDKKKDFSYYCVPFLSSSFQRRKKATKLIKKVFGIFWGNAEELYVQYVYTGTESHPGWRQSRRRLLKHPWHRLTGWLLVWRSVVTFITFDIGCLPMCACLFKTQYI